KEDCYVFDFAPDRTLKVLATVPRVSTKAGKTTEQQKRALAEFINFCPVIGMEGSRMVAYDANRMMEQLKKAYVERVVRNGFEDGYLYNDELLKLDGVELELFAKLKKIIGTTKAMAKSGDIDVNSQGLTDEQYSEKEKLEKKPKKQRTPEEEARLEELKEKKKLRDTAVSILRGISIRMPLLIYGAEITDEDEQLTIDNFTQLIDDQSWDEFMPKGVTKEVFNTFKKYYDDDIFAAAGKRIRSMARAADRLTIEERIERITDIFSTFRNPDKETVLTPWRVVNMHMGDCLGGYCFFNEDYTEQLSEPRYIDRHRVTDDVFTPGSYLMEINSKSGLYPLYLAYNLYRRALKDETHSPQTLEDHQRIWDRVVRESIFVICKTPMAKAITRRTLMGFRESKVNTRFFEDLVNQIKNKPDNFLSKVVKGRSFWKTNDNDNMKFKAIVGNPPYQEMDGGECTSSTAVYPLFVNIGCKLNPIYLSMITPSRWLTKQGRGLSEEWVNYMLNCNHIVSIKDYLHANDCFPGVEIKGGVCYFLFQESYVGKCQYTLSQNNCLTQENLYLGEWGMAIRDSKAQAILKK
ncbi:MAG: Eco57I restriction-modification methylase domain-containing protein, partial [Bacteroidales bacterium]|nr:Eco57I restriction-modification methylase domain-containing protein [Bacteroidales bacterium]